MNNHLMTCSFRDKKIAISPKMRWSSSRSFYKNNRDQNNEQVLNKLFDATSLIQSMSLAFRHLHGMVAFVNAL